MKPWIVINAQNRVIGRYASEGEASSAHSLQVSHGLVTIQYRPRAKRTVSRSFP